MKKKQKKLNKKTLNKKTLNKLFELLGKAVAYLLFCGTWSLILYFGFIVNTIY